MQLTPLPQVPSELIPSWLAGFSWAAANVATASAQAKACLKIDIMESKRLYVEITEWR
jgi:hypothetical protein